MSTSVNKGNQNLWFQYHDPLTAQEFNERNTHILATGIYKGGLPSKVSDSSVLIAPWVIAVSDGVYTVTGKSTTPYTIAGVSSVLPYLVGRWTFNTQHDWYVDLLAVANPAEYDIVFGKALYTGSVMTGISLTERSVPRSIENMLKVSATVPESMALRVSPGICTYGESTLIVPEQDTEELVAPLADSYIAIVYVDDTGAIQISYGTASATPTAPSHKGKIVIAEVLIPAGAVSIADSAIKDARPFLSLGGTGSDSNVAMASTTFDNTDLVSGVLTFTHNLNSTDVIVEIYDTNGEKIIPDSVDITDVNTVTVDLSSFGTITGDYKIVVAAKVEEFVAPEYTVVNDMSSPSSTTVPTTEAVSEAIAARAERFVPRGAGTAWDFTQAVLTANALWTNVDLSSIVPAGAKRVRVKTVSSGTGGSFELRPNNQSDETYNILHNEVITSGQARSVEGEIVLDSYRRIEYRAQPATTTRLIYVLGWWVNA